MDGLKVRSNEPQGDKRFVWDAESPYGIYADGKWKGMRENPLWKNRAADYAEPIYAKYIDETGGRQTDCKEKQFLPSPVLLARDLFFLHLTVRDYSAAAGKMIGMLYDFAENREMANGWDGYEDTDDAWFDLPFEKGDSFFPLHAWLFSTAVFGMHETEKWKDAAAKEGSRLFPPSESGLSGSRERPAAEVYNFLRGTIIVPQHGAIPGVAKAVDELEKLQGGDRLWRGIAPHQAFNALAHSPLPAAARQVEKALPALLALRNPDGSWGRNEREKPLATFLMAHALSGQGKFSPSNVTI